MPILSAATNELAQLINKLHLEATPNTPDLTLLHLLPSLSATNTPSQSNTNSPSREGQSSYPPPAVIGRKQETVDWHTLLYLCVTVLRPSQPSVENASPP